MFFRTLIKFRVALLFTVLATLPAFAQDRPPGNDVANASLATIARWISDNSDLPYPSEMPRVERVSPSQILRLRYDALLPRRAQAIGGEHSTPLPQVQREVVAVYDDVNRTIYLPTSWTGATTAEQSVLVHEMVHHMQNLAGLKYPCGGAREKPAYLVQRKWLADRGLDLEDEFQVDMFTIVALSACMS